jgi:hypothetical protein
MTRFAAPVGTGIILWLALLATAALPAHADDVGIIAAVEGGAEIGRAGTWTAATVEQGIATGDQLRTGPSGRLRVVFRDDSVILLGENTSLVIDAQVFDPNATRSLFSLVQGKLKSVVSHYYGAAGSSYEVQSPTAVAGVRGTEFVMSYDPATGETEIVGIRGVVTVHGAVDPTGPGLLVTANQVTDVATGELPSPARPMDPELMRQMLRDIEFFGSGQGTSLTGASTLIAGASVPQPARAPSDGGRGASLLLDPAGPSIGIDASNALGNSPAAVIAGGTGSIGVNPGRPR